jgi:hypothetical protein
MRNSLGILALVFAGAVGGSLLGPRARAQDPPPAPAPKPCPWDYKVFCMDYNEYSEKDDWKEFRARVGGNALKADAEFRSYVLNWLAKDGWELVQVVQLKTELGYFYLRRPHRDAPPPAASEQEPESDPRNLPPDDPRRPRKPH